jgi:hypothetical protein
LSARRREVEAQVFEDEEGDDALRSTERCLANLTPVASLQPIALLPRVDVATCAAWGDDSKGGSKRVGAESGKDVMRHVSDEREKRGHAEVARKAQCTPRGAR